MKTFAILAAAACVLGSSAAALAGQKLASPSIFGAHTQNKAQCIVRNIGTSSVSVKISIFNESGGVVAGGVSPVLVTAGHNASVYANISSGVAYACEAEPASGSAKNLRGTLILFDEVDLNDWEPLRSAELY